MSAIVSLALFLSFALAAKGFAAESQNVRLLGYSDLQGRPALQVVLKGNFAYVGHHSGTAANPLSGKMEPNGTSIVDVSDPSQPKLVHHIPGYAGAESRAVQVVENFYEGRDFLLRNQESGEFTGFEVWDITNRSHSIRISTIAPLEVAHKSWWDSKTGRAYLSGTWPGWHGRHLIIYDLKDPSRPKFIANWGLPGQEAGAEAPGGLGLHHPVILENRAYLSYLFGGDVVILDITQQHQPRMVAHMDFSPPFSGTHTTVPFLKMKVPKLSRGSGDIRDILVISEEAFASNCRELRRQIHIVDATVETKPVPIATFKVSDGDFCSRGGRFGPHQFAETRDGEIIGGTLVYIAYFNAGLRVVDISDPFHPREVGYYVPEAPLKRGTIQTNDVDLDYRGYIYITDRAGAGLHILEYIGNK
ncbi:LVIVD repeat-containing protein [Thermodesulfobacteriota bacterium]